MNYLSINKAYLGGGIYKPITQLTTAARKTYQSSAKLKDFTRMDKLASEKSDLTGIARASHMLKKIKTRPSPVKNIHYGASISSADKKILDKTLAKRPPSRNKVVIHTAVPEPRAHSGRRNSMKYNLSEPKQAARNIFHESNESTLAYALSGGRRNVSHVVINRETLRTRPEIIHHELAHTEPKKPLARDMRVASLGEEARANWRGAQYEKKVLKDNPYEQGGRGDSVEYQPVRDKLARVKTKGPNPFKKPRAKPQINKGFNISVGKSMSPFGVVHNVRKA